MMKHLNYACVAVLLGASMNAQAGLFNRHWGCAAEKCCDCAPTYQPTCCKPTIVRPCRPNVYTYQRKCSTLKPPCCDDCCAPSSSCAPCTSGACCDTGNGCCDTDGCCDAKDACCAPKACCPADAGCAAPCDSACCPGDPGCAAPCDNACCPTDTDCCVPQACGRHKCGGFFSRLFNRCKHDRCDACDAGCCDTGCDDACCPVTRCKDDPCKIAQLIYDSQTACYASQRKRAIHRLSDRYDCVCHPEIMCALIYALNDADPEVREKAADEIGDQLKKNPCCCSPKVVQALTCALGDCHRAAARQAEQALKRCGYKIVDPCCNVGCDSCCDAGCCPNGCAPAQAPAETAPEAAPAAPEAAPMPTETAPEAYLPRPLFQTSRRARTNRTLASLMGELFN